MCHGGWGAADAMVVCRQSGFPAEGEDMNCGCADAESTTILFTTTYRGNTLYQLLTQSMGIWNIRCTVNERKLMDCSAILNNRCAKDAGVICSKYLIP